MTADWSSTYSGSEEEILRMGTAVPPPTSLNTGDIQELSRVETPVTGEPAAGPADGIPPPNVTPWEMTEPPPDTNWGPTREGRIQCQICWTHVWGGPTNLQRHLEFSRYCRYYQDRMRRGEAPSEDTARENEDGEYTRRGPGGLATTSLDGTVKRCRTPIHQHLWAWRGPRSRGWADILRKGRRKRREKSRLVGKRRSNESVDARLRHLPEAEARQVCDVNASTTRHFWSKCFSSVWHQRQEPAGNVQCIRMEFCNMQLYNSLWRKKNVPGCVGLWVLNPCWMVAGACFYGIILKQLIYLIWLHFVGFLGLKV